MIKGQLIHQQKIEEMKEAMREQLDKCKPVDEIKQAEFDKCQA